MAYDGSANGMSLAKPQLAMTGCRATFLLVCLLLPVVGWAGDEPPPALAVPDAIYKGVVGKALDVVPMDPERRLVLQRTNAVVSNTLTGRSLSVWAGLTNPILLVGGLVWGLFAATHIKPDGAKARADTAILEPVRRVEIAESHAAILDRSPAGQESPAVAPNE
jgi:hypothetical protein